ncbi:ribosome associated membrane RAMP4 [Coccomyxa subellipsoidea C-169]|uniref:Ribosome associated membrane RAMP4 n=1 Tax=Coccomyxa subellipsoidea (strain C-169) TaxID=574566 RepID=I0YYQ2_COCSC|nr:ribosome associated membrane RAMP4 [Coccomyxa subellipsoidea C-169]EIE23521.1 ribosome associated membrane RAMP4 [Coccomyxa subellipsoidea C-169]|eukprot:XP_005648065.1 ribosome associated membrane RAMP4 [Coccomyxa subellipsoidea C-169]
MSYSKRIANAKSDKYHNNIHKRGKVWDGKEKSKTSVSAGPWLLGFFAFVLVGSAVLQVIRTANNGTPF